MRHCSGAVITVGGGASKTGLTDVEQGHNVVYGINPGQDHGQIAGRNVPIQMGASDIFASPTQHDLVDHQIAIGVFVMILNREVIGVDKLTTAQIQGIYTGVYQNWRQICHAQHQCGPDLPILPISRTLNSGTRFTFEKYVLGGVATAPGLGLERARSFGTAVQEVEANQGSISYTSLYLADQASQAHRITVASIDGRDPHTSSLVQRNQYTFWNIEHLYTCGQVSPLTQAFLNYMYSDTAQRLLSRYGFLRMTAVSQRIREEHVLNDR
jgi:phosphate transport system substrate-binding protein